MTNFEIVSSSFAAVMAAAKKFGDFVTPQGVTEMVNMAASKLEAGNEQEAASLLREAQAELARELRRFIVRSPESFRRQLAGIERKLDHPAYVAHLERAIVRYAADVRDAGWEPAAQMFAVMANIISDAPTMSAKIKAAKAAEIRRRMDAMDAAAAAAKKAEEAKRAAAIQAARHEAAERLRQMVASRKVA